MNAHQSSSSGAVGQAARRAGQDGRRPEKELLSSTSPGLRRASSCFSIMQTEKHSYSDKYFASVKVGEREGKSFQLWLYLNVSSTYFAPNSTGFRMQHGFETVLVQPYGYDGFRVRAWPFRPPNGNEISFLYDPPLEGPENGTAHGMSFDTAFNGKRSIAIRNGNTIVQTYGWAGNPGGYRLAFYRVEANGSKTLLTNEYAPLKSINPRYYYWNGPGYEFEAEFSFSTSPDEQIFGTGTQQDHMVNKKGQVIDLVNFNTHIPTPVFMSNRGYAFVWNSPSEGRMEFGALRNRFRADSTTVVDYAIVSAPQVDNFPPLHAQPWLPQLLHQGRLHLQQRAVELWRGEYAYHRELHQPKVPACALPARRFRAVP
ncbi:hypothetical protein M8818_002255 [Zalaria obscura]|uniref:Uncharacterized protein n=1 Tax=Zalaria obscura TaxID=2024903 RepID=A0ACC3SK86_9PEZI